MLQPYLVIDMHVYATEELKFEKFELDLQGVNELPPSG